MGVAVVLLGLACGGGDGGVVPTAPAPTPPADPSPPPSPPTDPTPAPPVEEACRDWEFLLSRDYQYLNNVWNKGTLANYEQCVMRRVVDGEDQFGWRWQWPDGGGEPKALPQVLYGQTPWSNASTTQSLPRQISSIATLQVDYELYVTAEGDFNVIFILWVTSADPPTPETVSHNIKIQVHQSESSRRTRPVVTNDPVAIDGLRFAFHSFPGGSSTSQPRTDFAFESLSDQLNTELNLLAFLNYLTQNGHVSADHFLGVVEMGIEIRSGSGEAWAGQYDIHTETRPGGNTPSPGGRLIIPRPDPTVPPVDPTSIPPVEEACGDWEELRETNYRYVNNVWNKGRITDYEQCVMRRVVGGEDQYGWRWRWPSTSDDVRAYPEVLFGQRPWDFSSTTTRLPRRLSSIRQLSVDYEVYLTAEGAFNLAFSMWTTSDHPPDPDGILHEIMIWVDWQRFYPGGEDEHVADGEIDGAEFSLYVRQHATDPETHPSLVGQKFLGFLMHADQFSGTLNLHAYLKYLVDHGYLPADHYLDEVELGNEVMNGSGELWLKTFEVTVR